MRPAPSRRSVAAVGATFALVIALAGCSDEGGDAPGSAAGAPTSAEPGAPAPGASEGEGPTGTAPEAAVALAASIRPALDAVEAELGAGQRYFEVTATAQLTNVFVAVDDATAVVAYAYLDGELQAPAPRRDGASGSTFGAGDVELDPATVLAGVAGELPSATIESLSVYGSPSGVTYVALARSEAGGLLDVELAADGRVLAVDPR